MTAQLRASQIENRHLRRCGAPLQLQELQDAYAQSTDALEVMLSHCYSYHSLCVLYLTNKKTAFNTEGHLWARMYPPSG